MKIANNIQLSEKTYSPAQNAQDSQLKAIQNQIENVKKRMQSLIENKRMNPEEKIEKQKALQEEMDALNQKLIARQNEIVRSKMKTNESQNQVTKTDEKVMTQNQSNASLETDKYATLQNLILADASFSQTKTLNAIKKEMIGQAKILKNQISTDRSRGMSSELKESQLSKLEENIDKTTSKIAQGHKDVDKLVEKSRNATQKKNSTSEKNDDVTEDDATKMSAVSVDTVNNDSINNKGVHNKDTHSEKNEENA
ncbi:hypothetical protein [Fusibacter ferrireducens]|uniref:hypothetical protein n=1 Tax=Fusibacter ferrireducens TaxID=2785058 RepID=UPI00188D5E31|nr:hypothetical protein [Fusibacter ferrireducens]